MKEVIPTMPYRTKERYIYIYIIAEQMAKTSAWKANRDLLVEGDQCRICGPAKKTVMHWLSG